MEADAIKPPGTTIIQRGSKLLDAGRAGRKVRFVGQGSSGTERSTSLGYWLPPRPIVCLVSAASVRKEAPDQRIQQARSLRPVPEDIMRGCFPQQQTRVSHLEKANNMALVSDPNISIADATVFSAPHKA